MQKDCYFLIRNNMSLKSFPILTSEILTFSIYSATFKMTYMIYTWRNQKNVDILRWRQWEVVKKYK